MQLLINILALSACVTAIPVTDLSVSSLIDRSSPSQADPSLALCEAARNCETYTNENGRVMVRFKKGMSPGSADYESRVQKRDLSNRTTTFRFSDKKIVWGCGIDPLSKISDAMKTRCSGGPQSCDENEVASKVKHLEPGNLAMEPVDANLALVMTGHWPTWGHDFFTDGLAMAARSVVHWDKNLRWTKPTPEFLNNRGRPTPTGLCDLATLSNFVDMTVYDGENMVGLMNFKATLLDEKSGFCKGLDVAGSVTGAIPGVGPGVSALIGVVKASCN